MIRELERNILLKMNYANRILAISNKYVDDGTDTPLFKKEEVKNMFHQLELKFKSKGNRYIVTKVHKNYKFEFHYLIRRNIIYIYIYIYIYISKMNCFIMDLIIWDL